jgi:hypothetical protein
VLTTTTTTTYTPVPNVPLEPTNECDVITIFPMGVECFTVNPTNTETFNGIASLVITGGTPPYQILWETGSVGTTITNLGVGNYSATVTDFYGDFLIQTTCELIAPPVPTTTTTTSTTTLPQFGDLCVILSTQKDKGYSNKFIDFIFDGYYNEKPSWFASLENLFMYWNTGTTNQWLISGLTSNTLYNPNPTQPPTSGWAFLGPTKTLVNVVEGSCDNIPPLGMQITKNNSTCQNDGSIIINAYGGIPPYTYSLNGGFTTQSSPIFQNLAGGNYNATVIDSVGITETQLVTITSTVLNTTYVITLNKTGNNFSVAISPSLPVGVSVTFDLIYNYTFNVAPLATSAVNVITPSVLLNSTPITNPSPVITNTTSFNPCNGGSAFTTNNVYTWQNITMTTSTTLNGNLSNTITPIYPIPPCYSVSRTNTLYLENLTINGCECCSVIKQQTGNNSASIG